MSRVVDVCVVVDRNENNATYVKEIKKQLPEICEEIKSRMNAQLRVALVHYGFNDKIKGLMFEKNRNIGSLIKLLPPPIGKRSYQKVVNVFGALKKALSYKWKSADKILILIAHNPQYGKVHHNLVYDPHAFGLPDAQHYEEILKQIGDKSINFMVLNINGALTKLNRLWEQSSKRLKVHFKATYIKSGQEISEKISMLLTSITSGNNYQNQQINNVIDDKKDQNIDTSNELKWYKDTNNKLIPVYICDRKSSASTWTVFDGRKIIKVDPKLLKQSNNKLAQSMIQPIQDVLKKAYSLYKTQQAAIQHAKKAKNDLEKKIQSALTYNAKNMGSVRWMLWKEQFYPVVIVQSAGAGKTCIVNEKGSYYRTNKKNIFNVPSIKSNDDIVNCIKNLKLLAQDHLIYKTSIKCGVTQCEWLASKGGLWSSDTYSTGIIAGINNINNSQNFMEIKVKPADFCYTKKYQYFDLKKVTLLNNNEANKGNNEKLDREIRSLQQKVTKLQSERDRAQKDLQHQKVTTSDWKQKAQKSKNDIRKLKKVQDDLNKKIRSKEYDITKKKQQITSQLLQMQQLRDECSNATITKQEAEEKFENMSEDYFRIKDLSAQFRKEKQERTKLVQTLRGRLLDQSSALDFSIGFPAIQDIVAHFDTVRSQYLSDAAKPIKKILKKTKSDLSRIRHNKIINKILFNILISSYSIIKEFEKEQYNKIADVHGIKLNNNNKNPKIYKMIIETYRGIINKKEKELVNIILSKYCNEFKLYGLSNNKNNNDCISLISIYIKECILVCWEIVLSRDPSLIIQPLIFEPVNKNDIEFDDELYSEGYGSEITESLNFIVWPAIYRNDTKQNISKITAVFLDKLPQWSKKKLKQIKKQQEEIRKKEEEEKKRKKEEERLKKEAELKKKREKERKEKAAKEEAERLKKEREEEIEREKREKELLKLNKNKATNNQADDGVNYNSDNGNNDGTGNDNDNNAINQNDDNKHQPENDDASNAYCDDASNADYTGNDDYAGNDDNDYHVGTGNDDQKRSG